VRLIVINRICASDSFVSVIKKQEINKKEGDLDGLGDSGATLK